MKNYKYIGFGEQLKQRWRKLFTQRTKCFVVHFNRPTFLLRQLEVLSMHPRLDIYVIDNYSSTVCRQNASAIADRFGAKFIQMPRNYGHSVVWDAGLSVKYANRETYIVTDCDVIPNGDVDFVAILERGIVEYPKVNKVGLELNISRIPEGYSKKNEVLRHERGFIYRKVLSSDFQECAVDTTFALYRAGYHSYSVWGTDTNEWGGQCLSLRTVSPQYEADHLGWHLVSPYNAETIQYFESIRNSHSGHWKE